MMIIKEIWVPIDKDEDDVYSTEFKQFNVISIGSKSIFNDDKKIGETVYALAYDPITGKIEDIPLELTHIKTLQDDRDKTSQSITFSAPEPIRSRTGRENG